MVSPKDCSFVGWDKRASSELAGQPFRPGGDVAGIAPRACPTLQSCSDSARLHLPLWPFAVTPPDRHGLARAQPR